MRMTKDIADRAAKKMVQELHNNLIPDLKKRDQIIFDLYKTYIKVHDMKFFLGNQHLFQPITGFVVIGNGISYHRHVGLNNIDDKLPWFPYLKENGIKQGDYNKPVLDFNLMDDAGIRKSAEYIKAYAQIETKKKDIKKLEDKIYSTLLSFTTIARAVNAFPEAKDYLPTEKEVAVASVPSIRIEEILKDLKQLGHGNK
jgi:hypothetical protein